MRCFITSLVIVCAATTQASAQISVRPIELTNQASEVRGFVATIDLADPNVRPVVDATSTPAEIAAAKQAHVLLIPTDKFAQDNHLACAINANYFGWRPGGGSVIGLAVNDGVTLSPMRSWKGTADPALVILKEEKGWIGYIIGAGQPAIDPSKIRYAVAGVGGSETDTVPGTLLVQDGKNLGATARVSHSRSLARTAAGLDASGHHLYLVVVDCVPHWSAGMTLPQLADFMIGLGVKEALNLDGGGSASFVYRLKQTDSYKTNKPCDESGNGHPGVFRPVAVRLGFGLSSWDAALVKSK